MMNKTNTIIINVIEYLRSNEIPSTQIVLQKSIYFLKDYGLPLALRFMPCCYGVSSLKLSDILKEMTLWDEIEIKESEYLIKTPGEYAELPEVRTGMEKMAKLVNNKFDFNMLTLFSLSLYCYRALETVNESTEIMDFIEEFKEWKKGELTINMVEHCYDRLEKYWL